MSAPPPHGMSNEHNVLDKIFSLLQLHDILSTHLHHRHPLDLPQFSASIKTCKENQFCVKEAPDWEPHGPCSLGIISYNQKVKSIDQQIIVVIQMFILLIYLFFANFEFVHCFCRSSYINLPIHKSLAQH